MVALVVEATFYTNGAFTIAVRELGIFWGIGSYALYEFYSGSRNLPCFRDDRENLERLWSSTALVVSQ
jgi:hypothetical protein